MKSELLKEIQNKVEKLFNNDSSGHNYWHIQRVVNTGKYIANIEHADIESTILIALLHDVGDYKLHGGSEERGERFLEDFLRQFHLPLNQITDLTTVINQISYKGAGVADDVSSLEGKIVQDADRLDAIGAIGIARAFTYGGSKNQSLHDTSLLPISHNSFHDYKNSNGTTINHFYEKLLLLKNRLHTETAKKIAVDRHAFMEGFLKQFYKEWDEFS